ncbi:hypothetical protein PAXRUDRAFT_824929, partial [Paxillus rubicundulus Ve08.2h10]
MSGNASSLMLSGPGQSGVSNPQSVLAKNCLSIVVCFRKGEITKSLTSILVNEETLHLPDLPFDLIQAIYNTRSQQVCDPYFRMLDHVEEEL